MTPDEFDKARKTLGRTLVLSISHLRPFDQRYLRNGVELLRADDGHQWLAVDFPGGQVLPMPCGWLVCVLEAPTPEEFLRSGTRLSDEFFELASLLRAQRIEWAYLDIDADTVAGLPVFD